jgi:hypothetical protein
MNLSVVARIYQLRQVLRHQCTERLAGGPANSYSSVKTTDSQKPLKQHAKD